MQRQEAGRGSPSTTAGSVATGLQRRPTQRRPLPTRTPPRCRSLTTTVAQRTATVSRSGPAGLPRRTTLRSNNGTMPMATHQGDIQMAEKMQQAPTDPEGLKRHLVDETDLEGHVSTDQPIGSDIQPEGMKRHLTDETDVDDTEGHELKATGDGIEPEGYKRH